MGDPGTLADGLSIPSLTKDEDEHISSPSPPHPNSSSPPSPLLPAPTAEEIETVIAALSATLRVTTAPSCPEHPDLWTCSCPVALATLSSSDLSTLTRRTFCRLFDAELLRFTRHALDYDGSQPAHHLFVYKARTTPKHWLRTWLHDSVAASLFAPRGQLKPTIQALLNYWTMRTRQWKAQPPPTPLDDDPDPDPDTDTAWFAAEYGITYPSAKEGAFATVGAPARGQLPFGDECLELRTSFSFTSHSSSSRASSKMVQHTTAIALSPTAVLSRGFGVRYHVWDPCHEDCEVMTPRRQQWVANWVAAELARRLGYTDCWSGKGVGQETAGAKWTKIRF